MKRNSRLSLALHTLSHMAKDANQVSTSAEIAEHAGTNPVVVRRVLGLLREAGLLTSTRGYAGGWKLTKPPQEISLADVYLALGESLVSGGSKKEIPSCSLEHALHRRINGIMKDIEKSLVERLRETSIAEIAK